MTTVETPKASGCVAFVGERLVASGDRRSVVLQVKALVERGQAEGVLFFDDATGKQFDVNLQGTAEQVLEREVPEPPAAGRGRPKLGVTPREVTLLPRDWEWLEQQPNGASAALRRLVAEARAREPDEASKRRARDAAYHFMTAVGGDLPDYEEALRALYAKDQQRFHQHIEGWPVDIKQHVSRLAEGSF